MARVLVVDDDPSVCRSLTYFLHTHGHDVQSAGSLAEGLTTLAKWPADVVLTDFLFPVGSSVVAISKTLRGPDRPRVIVYTGISDADIHERLLRLGVDGVFVKGSDSPRKLAEAVQNAVRAKRHSTRHPSVE